MKTLPTSIGLLVAALYLSGSVRAVDFQDPTTAYYSVEKFAYLDRDRGFTFYQGSGFFAPKRGDLPARVFMLPGIAVDLQSVEAISKKGRKIQLEEDMTEDLTSLRIPVRYRDPLPAEEVGAAIAAAIAGQPLIALQPRPVLEPNGFPAIFPPAQTNPQITNGIIQATNIYRGELQAQQKWIDEWKTTRAEKATINSLKVSLIIDGDEVSTSEISGALVSSGGRLTWLTIKAPDQAQINRIREGTFEIKSSYKFRDASVQSIEASYDFRKFMSSFLEETRTAVTNSRTSGWKIFGIGSRKTSVRRFINEESRNNTQVDVKTKTAIEIEDADDNFVAQFESQFFPELSKERTIDSHLAAAQKAESEGNKDLAKVHLDYVTALRADNKDSEIDAVKAAAALSSGNYAMFVAEGVRFRNDKDTLADSFHQIITATVSQGASVEWASRKTRSTQRSVTSITEADRQAEPGAWLGLISAADYNIQTQFGPRAYLVPTCIAEGGPLHRAGILPGVLISAFDGNSVTNADQLKSFLDDRSPGDQISLSIMDPQNPNAEIQREVRLGTAPPK